mmetsp:Transcript_13340/g.31446  ORF Transcript_13340/g.31446 Transcript_13340/m.31446 type:complete len:257 (+) Transcript_13340:968-1738(+)
MTMSMASCSTIGSTAAGWALASVAPGLELPSGGWSRSSPASAAIDSARDSCGGSPTVATRKAPDGCTSPSMTTAELRVKKPRCVSACERSSGTEECVSSRWYCPSSFSVSSPSTTRGPLRPSSASRWVSTICSFAATPCDSAGGLNSLFLLSRCSSRCSRSANIVCLLSAGPCSEPVGAGRKAWRAAAYLTAVMAKASITSSGSSVERADCVSTCPSARRITAPSTALSLRGSRCTAASSACSFASQFSSSVSRKS